MHLYSRGLSREFTTVLHWYDRETVHIPSESLMKRFKIPNPFSSAETRTIVVSLRGIEDMKYSIKYNKFEFNSMLTFVELIHLEICHKKRDIRDRHDIFSHPGSFKVKQKRVSSLFTNFSNFCPAQRWNTLQSINRDILAWRIA